MVGTITLYMGCMYSGKTSILIREYFRWKSINKKTLVINHSIDNRYTSESTLVSHDSVSIPCVLTSKLSDIKDETINQVEAIFINEGQFFDDLKSKVIEWCENKDKHIFVAGLDADRHRQPFGQMLDLIPYADEYQKMLAKCQKCLDGTNAPFTYCKIRSNNQILVGYSEYEPLCRTHYLEQTNKL